MRPCFRWPSMPSVSAADRLVTLPQDIPPLTLGWEAVKWVSKYLRQPNGTRAGDRFELVDSQLRFLLHWYAIDEDGSWLYHHGVRRLSKGSGKSPFAAVLSLIELCAPVRLHDFDSSAPGGCKGVPVAMPLVQIAATAESQPLALGTPVRTTHGWSTIGDLAVGDLVFSSSGDPVPVARTTNVFHGEQCYRVSFDDGEQIVASASHGWTVEARNGHGDGWDVVTMTTAEMSEFRQRPQNRQRSLRIPLVPVAGEKRDLSVAPYLLGLWLGDGSKSNGVIAIDWRHRAEIEALLREQLLPWEDLRFTKGPGNQGIVNVKRRDGICPRGHDYINDPANWYEQAGHPACRKCIKWPRTGRFDSRKPSLRERLRAIGVLQNKHVPDDYLQAGYADRMELLCGLIDSDGSISTKGRASFVNADERLFDQVCDLIASLGFRYSVSRAEGTARRVHFVPRAGEPVAKLEYKARRQSGADRPLSRYRRVTSVIQVESVPVKCIGIDTVDHLFNVGRRGVLTHNTTNTMRMVRAFAPKGSRVCLDHNLEFGRTRYNKLPEGALEVITSSSAAAEGAESTHITADETEWWTPANGGPTFAATLLDNLTKSGNRMLETCNSWKPGIGSVAEDSYDSWLAQEEGRSRNESRILYDARIAPPDTDMSDDESLRRALEHVYGDCWWADIRPIMVRIWDPKSRPDDSKRKYLNWPTAPEGAWADPQDWAKIADPHRVVADREAVVLFFDGSKTRDTTALLGCCLSDGHVFTIDVWEPDNSHASTDAVPVEAIDAAVERSFDRYDVQAFFADVKEWEGFTKVTWPQRYKSKLTLWAVPGGKQPEPIAWDMRSHVYDFVMAAELCEAEIREGRFTHDGDARTARHIRNARRADTRWGISVKKESPDSPDKIDAAVCVIGVRMVWRLVKAKTPEKKRTGKATFV